MTAISSGTLLVILCASLLAQTPASEAPWATNKPIVQVRKEVYVHHTKRGTAAMVAVRRVGSQGEREEIQTTMGTSDTPKSPRRRRSCDEGRTWSDWEPLPPLILHPQKGVEILTGPELQVYDPASGKGVWIWLRCTRAEGGPYFHCFWRLSEDAGRNWGAPKLLRYEAGDDFDPEHATNPHFLKNNQSYMGQSIIRCRDGSLVFAAAEVNVDEPLSAINPKGVRTWDKPADVRSIGASCFIARWNATKKDYDWEAGKPVWLPRHISSRGLAEPDLAELKDGRLWLVFRGSNSGLNSAQAPGRKWYSLSSDGGKTLSPPKELKYDDGTSFYSASSIHALFRDKRSSKLYWIGNISITPAAGNSPRYPLVIAEVDESIPALRRSTVTLIDDRQEGDSEALQLSNFSLLQNRDSGALEIYLTRLGENPDDFWGADSYKYTLTFQ